MLEQGCGPIEAVMNHKHKAYTSHHFQALLAQLRARHITTPPYTPLQPPQTDTSLGDRPPTSRVTKTEGKTARPAAATRANERRAGARDHDTGRQRPVMIGLRDARRPHDDHAPARPARWSQRLAATPRRKFTSAAPRSGRRSRAKQHRRYIRVSAVVMGTPR